MDKRMQIFEILGVFPCEVFSFSNNCLSEYYTLSDNLILTQVTEEGRVLEGVYKGVYNIDFLLRNADYIKTNSDLSIRLVYKEAGFSPYHYTEATMVGTSVVSHDRDSTLEYLKVLSVLRYFEGVYPDNDFTSDKEHWFYAYDIEEDDVVLRSYKTLLCSEFTFPTKHIAESVLRIIGKERYKNFLLYGKR